VTSLLPLRRTAPLLPSGLAAAAAALVAWREEGSLAAPDWLPLAVLAVLVLATVALAGTLGRPPRAVAVGCAALTGLAALSALSIAWSPSPSGARDEALLTLFYAATLLVPAVTLAGEGERLDALRVTTYVLGALGILTALDLAASGNPLGLLFAGRLDFPVSYVNACSALFAVGIWPAAVTASDHAASLAARVAGVASCAVFVALDEIAQSKGTVVGIVASGLVVFAVAPQRLRLVPALVVAAAPAVALFGPLTGPYRSPTAAATHHAGFAALAAAAAAALLGAGYVLLDRRLTIGPARRLLIGRIAAVLTAAAVAAGVAAFLAVEHSPSAWARRTWHAFKHPTPAHPGATHLTALGSHRYDFWRVALDEGTKHPLGGIGARGFYSAYLRHGRTNETPLRAHSLYLDAFAELGVPGLLLLLVGAVTPLVALARKRAQPSAIAALGAGTYFFAHAAVDWIWTVPVVGVPAFLLVGAGCAPDLRRGVSVAASRLAAGLAVALALFAFAPPWLAHQYVVAAASARDPGSDLAHARTLDPLSLDPYWVEWRRADGAAGRVAALRRAHSREPLAVPVLYQLGLAYEQLGRRADALRALRRAAELAPRQRTIRKALLTASR